MSARTFDFCTRASREASPLACRTSSSSHARSKWSSSERLLRPVMTRTSESPAATASSTTYWIAGLSTTGSISFGVAFVAGRKRVPRPAAGMTALVTTGPSDRSVEVCSCSRSVMASPLSPRRRRPCVGSLSRADPARLSGTGGWRGGKVRHELTGVHDRLLPGQDDLGEAPAVPARGLRDVERGIGRAQDLARGPAVVGERRDAGRHGDRLAGGADRERPGTHGRDDAGGDGGGAVRPGLGQHDGELLAAVARDRVDLAQAVLQAAGELAEHPVAESVPVAVVDGLEVVEVEH